MRDIQLVEQTNDYNCGAAALAMILGLSDPEEIERDYMGRQCSTSHADRGVATGQVGVFMDEAQRVLFEAGVPAVPYVDLERCMAAGAWVCGVWDRVRIAEYDFLRTHLAAGGTAMLTVPSLNSAGGEHWIVVSGGKVFDPSTGKKYAAYAEIPKLLGAILIGTVSGVFQPKTRAGESKHSAVAALDCVVSDRLRA
jgi:hypothetical protein